MVLTYLHFRILKFPFFVSWWAACEVPGWIVWNELHPREKCCKSTEEPFERSNFATANHDGSLTPEGSRSVVRSNGHLSPLGPVMSCSAKQPVEPDWRSWIFKMLMVHQNPASVFVATVLPLLHMGKYFGNTWKHQIKHWVSLVCLPLSKMQKRLVSCGSSPWVQVPMVPMRWALLRLRTSLKEGDMISFRVEIGSGKAEAVNVELIWGIWGIWGCDFYRIKCTIAIYHYQRKTYPLPTLVTW